MNNVAMGPGFVSPVIDTLQADGIAWEGVATGTPGGALTFESSNQWDAQTNPNAVFITAPASVPALPVPAGAGFSFMVTTPGVSKHQGFGRFVRLRGAAGTAGVLNLWVCGAATI